MPIIVVFDYSIAAGQNRELGFLQNLFELFMSRVHKAGRL